MKCLRGGKTGPSKVLVQDKYLSCKLGDCRAVQGIDASGQPVAVERCVERQLWAGDVEPAHAAIAESAIIAVGGLGSKPTCGGAAHYWI